MPATAARFTFDLDLGMTTEKPRSMSENALAEMLAAARAEGHAEGLTEGENGVNARNAKALAGAAQALANRTMEMAAAVDDARAEILDEAVGLAVSVGRKLARNLVSREPLAEIEELIRECLSGLEAAPHLVIRCAPELADAVKDIATAGMATSSFAGRLVVMGDPDQQPGNCRLEWVDGGLVRDIAAIEAEIDTRINAYIAAHGGTQEPAR